MSGTKILKLVFSRDKSQSELNRVLHEFKKLSYGSKLSSKHSGKRHLTIKPNIGKLFGQNTILFDDIELYFIFDDEVSQPRHQDYDVILYEGEHKKNFNTISSYIFKMMCDETLQVGVVTHHDLAIKYFTTDDVKVLENIIFGHNSYKVCKVDSNLDTVKDYIKDSLTNLTRKCDERVIRLELEIKSTDKQKEKYLKLIATI